jgi:hypothetical protein
VDVNQVLSHCAYSYLGTITQWTEPLVPGEHGASIGRALG